MAIQQPNPEDFEVHLYMVLGEWEGCLVERLSQRIVTRMRGENKNFLLDCLTADLLKECGKLTEASK